MSLTPDSALNVAHVLTEALPYMPAPAAARAASRSSSARRSDSGSRGHAAMWCFRVLLLPRTAAEQ